MSPHRSAESELKAELGLFQKQRETCSARPIGGAVCINRTCVYIQGVFRSTLHKIWKCLRHMLKIPPLEWYTKATKKLSQLCSKERERERAMVGFNGLNAPTIGTFSL